MSGTWALRLVVDLRKLPIICDCDGGGCRAKPNQGAIQRVVGTRLRSTPTGANLRSLIVAFAITAALAGTAHADGIKGYYDEATAEKACRSPVVWANPDSKDHIYHVKGSRWYGRTRIGAYVCQAAADAHGWRQAENEPG